MFTSSEIPCSLPEQTKFLTGLIDTHCHLDFPEFDADRASVIARAKSCGVDYIINVGSNIVSSKNSVELAKKYDFIYAAVGIHPHDADSISSNDLIELEDLAKDPKVKAIGEIGLDYYRNLSSQENQKKIFQGIILISKKLNLPLIIHNRASDKDTLEILKKYLPLKCVVHCFSGDEEFLNQCLDLGFFISFTANITYKNASKLREVVKITPLEKIFIETDAPYLVPQVYRGQKKNEPAFVKFVAQEIANIKNEAIEKVVLVTSSNARGFFKI